MPPAAAIASGTRPAVRTALPPPPPLAAATPAAHRDDSCHPCSSPLPDQTMAAAAVVDDEGALAEVGLASEIAAQLQAGGEADLEATALELLQRGAEEGGAAAAGTADVTARCVSWLCNLGFRVIPCRLRAAARRRVRRLAAAPHHVSSSLCAPPSFVLSGCSRSCPPSRRACCAACCSRLRRRSSMEVGQGSAAAGRVGGRPEQPAAAARGPSLPPHPCPPSVPLLAHPHMPHPPRRPHPVVRCTLEQVPPMGGWASAPCWQSCTRRRPSQRRWCTTAWNSCCGT